MAKFNSPTTGSMKTTNHSGFDAYRMPDKAKLITQVLTSFFDEKKFYGDNSDDIKETLKRVIKDDPEFVSKLAVYARREFNMRSISHVLTAYLAHEVEGKPYVKETVRGVTVRGDDVTEIMSCYISEFGKPIPNSLKKGIANAFKGFDEYTLAKYKGTGKSVTMADILNLCHPKPANRDQEILWKKVLEGELDIPETWETELSAHGNNKETWEKLLNDNAVGYMAMLRNLRNIVDANPSNIGKVYAKIANPEAVRKSKQLPFRFLSAYKALIESGFYGNSVWVKSKLMDALEDAIKASLDNLPKIPGKTLIAIDVSGSMSSPISNRSEMTCSEVSTLMGIIASKLCEESIVWSFDTSLHPFDISRRAGILYSTVNEHRCGGGTNMGIPFLEMMDKHIDVDRVIILSDNECNRSYDWCGRRDKPVQSLADEYRRKSGNDIWVHAIDLQGYGTQQFCGAKTNIIAGWSEKVFDFILLAEAGEGSLEKTISNYSW